MPGPAPKSKREAVVEAYLTRKAADKRVSLEQVAKEMRVGSASLKRWLRAYRSEGRLEALPHGGGAGPKLSDAQQRQVADYALANRELRLYELAAWVEQEFGVVVAQSTVRKYLRNHGVSKRALSRVASNSEPEPAPEQRTRYGQRHRRRATNKPHRMGYPSDLTDAEWATLEPLLLGSTRRLPRDHSAREIVDALRYLSRTGCAWRYLPHDFPPHQTVREYFDAWARDGTFEKINSTLQRKLRKDAGREETPSVLIIDSQSVKTTEKGGSAATTAERRSTAGSDTSP